MQNCVQLLLQTASIFIHTRSSFSLVVGCDAAGKITGIIFGVVGPTFAAILWLSITFSYRQEKAKVICGVMRHVATADITSNSSAFIGTAHNEAQKQKARDSLKMPLDTDSEPQAGLHPAGPDSIMGQSTTRPVFGRSPNIDRAASLGSSIGRSSSIGLLGQLHRTASADSKTTAEVHQSRCLCSCCKCVRRLLCIGSDLCWQSQFLHCTWQGMSGLLQKLLLLLISSLTTHHKRALMSEWYTALLCTADASA